MTHGLLSIACHIYGAAAFVYLAYLVRQSPKLAWAGRLLVGAGLGLHGAGLGIALFAQGGAPVGLGQGFSSVAFLLLAIFFGVDLAKRVPVLGAFLSPIALALLIPALLLEADTGAETLRAPLLPLHITVALLGLAAFAVATGVGVVYLLMERQVKGKKFGLLFSRLPPLQVLDELNRWLVVWGFVALSVTFVSGAFFASSAPGAHWSWHWKELGTAAAWVVFATVLGARSFAGWRGRKVAMLTMAGFALVLGSFLTAYLPGSAGGVP
jgi:ABC-type uncharacterized transport system permease subunit